MKYILKFLIIVTLFASNIAFAAPEGAEKIINASKNLEIQNFLKESPQDKAKRMEWWKDARFGMFIHWGLYAVPAGEYRGVRVPGIGEWIMNSLQIPIKEYERFGRHFNPTQFNADEWVLLAKRAGMKYIVITSKHHDGFGLWDSGITDWDIGESSPYEKDILKELAEACKRHGIVLCFYHSIMDWHHPDAQGYWEPYYQRGRGNMSTNPRFPQYIENYMKPQLYELLTDYGDIGVLWFDGEWPVAYTTEMGKDVYNFVRTLQPDIIINNRVDVGRQGMMGFDREGDFAGDFGTPEKEIPDTGVPGVDWESCLTMNDTWGYKRFDDNWKSDTVLIHNLIDIVSKGGNLLLNIGPMANGLIPQPSVTSLENMGKWMDVNGESIHGADASPVEHPSWGRYTTKEDTLYAHVFEWPDEGRLILEGVGEISNPTLLTSKGGKKLKILSKGDAYVIEVPSVAPDTIASVIKFDRE